jgi:hypothetical protein
MSSSVAKASKRLVRRELRAESRRIVRHAVENTKRLPMRYRLRHAWAMIWGDAGHGLITGKPGKIL